MLHWLTTEPNPRSPATGFDAGRKGWRVHIVEAAATAKVTEIRGVRALCGILPRYGWGMDLFSDAFDKCERCLSRLDPEKCDDCGRVVGYYDPTLADGEKIVIAKPCGCLATTG